MDEMESIKQTFFQECEDLLRELESGLILLKDGQGDPDSIDSVFRAVHSIKGGAGAFSLTELVSFSHTFENVLDDLRSSKLDGNDDIYETLLESSDTLNDLVAAARDNQDWDSSASADLLERLKTLSSKDISGTVNPSVEDDNDFGFEPVGMPIELDFAFEPITSPLQMQDSTPSILEFSISFKPFSSMFEKGHSVTRLMRHLKELGDVDIICKSEELVGLKDIDPGESYLAWDITLKTSESRASILEIFDFVVDDCELNITSANTEISNAEGSSLDHLLGTSFALEKAPMREETDKDAPLSFNNPQSAKNLTEVNLETGKNSDSALDNTESSALAIAAKPAISSKAVDTKKAPPATIRINLERVDRLINQVGELVINQAMLSQCISDAEMGQSPEVVSVLDEFKQLTRDIQDSVMAIRAQPVQPLFQRMSRIVREAAQSTNKKAKLVLEGEFTEVDKTIIEKLADPLTHMIRNAIDHGLETPEKRSASGKSPEGTVTLSAAHRSGKIIIEVSDNGAGINREKVKSLAISKGLIAPETILNDTEIDNLLFLPGFSTVDKVSTLSGRGVGMDVVKRAIQSFGGRISINSEPGAGSKFTISLPLTLAVLDGMLVEVSEQTIVIPLTSIIETLLPKPSDIHDISPSEQVINVRGSFMPLINLAKKLNFENGQDSKSNPIVLCVETEDGKKYALMADAIQDQRQVVIKSLEDNYGQVPCIAAATILGDGRIALIADIDEIVRSDAVLLTQPAELKTLELAHA
ncbi:chemotaxis protein CheA [Hellea sp.]|nr:chemotaxis protein CheA [Hellea sp.]